MGNERTGRKVLHLGQAIRQGQLLEFIAQQKQRALGKGTITQAKAALSRSKARTVRPTSSKGKS